MLHSKDTVPPLQSTPLAPPARTVIAPVGIAIAPARATIIALVAVMSFVLFRTMAVAGQEEDSQHVLVWKRLVDLVSTSGRRVSPRTIQRIIRKHPNVLITTTIGDGRWTVLHHACHDGCPSTIIRILVYMGPGAAQMTGDDGSTPLHVACENSGSSCAETISILMDAYPGALVRMNEAGETPVHLACQRESPQVLQLILSQCPSYVLGISGDGWTPLHEASYQDVSIDIIRQMIRMYPKALFMMTEVAYETPLRCACRSPSPSLKLI
jgi:hypothetical protein